MGSPHQQAGHIQTYIIRIHDNFTKYHRIIIKKVRKHFKYDESNSFNGRIAAIDQKFGTIMHWGKSEQRTKIFGANLNIFVIAARTVRFSGQVYYDIRTLIQAKIC